MIRMCQLPDVPEAGADLCRWPDGDITWTLLADSLPFSEAIAREALELAFLYWAEHAAVRPRYVASANQARVVIGFGQIDGPSRTLAWSEMPCDARTRQVRQMFDNREQWVVSERPLMGEIDLVRTAAHEIGHALGVPHIGGGNLMQPQYSNAIRKPQAGDVAEIKARYPLTRTEPKKGPSMDFLPGWKSYIGALGALLLAAYYFLATEDRSRAYEFAILAWSIFSIRKAIAKVE